MFHETLDPTRPGARSPHPPGRLAPARWALLACVLAFATPVAAQNVVLDEGAFRVSLHGRVVGTETFAIRRAGQGAEAHVIASADIELDLPAGAEVVKPLLQTGADHELRAYQLEVAGLETLDVAVTASGRRLLARSRSPAGDQEREFRAVPGEVVLEQGVAHQYWFLSGLAEGATATALIPRLGEQGRIEVRSVRPEAVRVGNAELVARHATFAVDGALHEVWYDTEGRVLRVRIPSSGYAAERTDR